MRRRDLVEDSSDRVASNSETGLGSQLWAYAMPFPLFHLPSKVNRASARYATSYCTSSGSTSRVHINGVH
jgi:hypothetical protein